MADENADTPGKVNWHWADEQIVEEQTVGRKSALNDAFKVLLFFADDLIVALVVAYVIYRLLR
jgi:hypothetical protein